VKFGVKNTLDIETNVIRQTDIIHRISYAIRTNITNVIYK